LGENNLLQQDVSHTDLIFLYSTMGVLFLIIAYGIWNLKWWAFPLALVVQGMVIAVARGHFPLAGAWSAGTHRVGYARPRLRGIQPGVGVIAGCPRRVQLLNEQ